MHRNAFRAAALLAGLSGVAVLAGWAFAGTKGLQFGLVVAVAINGLVYFYGSTAALRAMRARPISEIEQPVLYRIVRELATEARQPMPKVYLSPTASPNAFATGHSPRSAVICCTTGLLRLLSERELRAVIAHELAHVRRRDTLVCSVAATVAAIIGSLTALALLLPFGDSDDDDGPGLLSELLFLVLGPIAAAVIHLGVSRAREHRADADAARLTGDPIGLASALRRIEVGIRIHPLPAERPLLASAHLMIAHPFPDRGMGRLFSAHPPTAERIRRLRAQAAEWEIP
ncbi:M48 family metalloprotease [Nocardiopsis mangrovi]|uniref:Protease HtpX homolog n=1 Tax=Nocardiopsis mangrovi TaxID=1179818 RepID=A0ABV9E6I0_9ACTN